MGAMRSDLIPEVRRVFDENMRLREEVRRLKNENLRLAARLARCEGGQKCRD